MIDTPGKFEGCPDYAAYFWDLALNGEGDTVGDMTMIVVEPEDRVLYPELEDAFAVKLREDDNGFVYVDVIPKNG